jgi:hypothetical protein
MEQIDEIRKPIIDRMLRRRLRNPPIGQRGSWLVPHKTEKKPMSKEGRDQDLKKRNSNQKILDDDERRLRRLGNKRRKLLIESIKKNSQVCLLENDQRIRPHPHQLLEDRRMQPRGMHADTSRSVYLGRTPQDRD